MTEVREELGYRIRAYETAAQTHIDHARRAHTDFQRSFHEQRAAEALQRAHKYRQQLQHLSNDR